MDEKLLKLDPRRGQMPLRAVKLPEERVLHVHLDTDLEPQRSLCESLMDLGPYAMVPWPRYASRIQLQDDIQAIAKQHMPSLIWMQLQTPGVIYLETLKSLRDETRDPRMRIVVWCGDIGRDQTWELEFSKHVDLMLYSSMKVVRQQRERGMQNAMYLQIGYDEGWNYPYTEDPKQNVQPRWFHDVVFCGQNYDEKRWEAACPNHECALRRDLVIALEKAFPGYTGRTVYTDEGASNTRFGLYGQRWEAAGPGMGSRTTNPAEAADIYRRSKVAVSISLTPDERYSSDRLHRALACGVPVVCRYFDDAEGWGLHDSQNVCFFHSIEEAVLDAQFLLAHPDRAAEIGAAGAKLARDHLTWGVRMREQAVYLAATRGEEIEVYQP